jgi:hypothetical protein
VKIRRELFVLTLTAVFLFARPCRASLAIFNDGRVVKISDYRVKDDDIELFIPGGGSFTTELNLVGRIIDDEIRVSPAEVQALSPRAKEFNLSYDSARKPLFSTSFDRLIEEEAKRADLDAELVSAVIRAESNFNPRARSRKGARGLMQLMPATAARLGLRRSYDPAANVRAGVRYLKELAKRFGNRPELILAAYNAGEQAVDNYGGVPPYRETVDYVRRILGWWSPAVKTPSV